MTTNKEEKDDNVPHLDIKQQPPEKTSGGMINAGNKKVVTNGSVSEIKGDGLGPAKHA